MNVEQYLHTHNGVARTSDVKLATSRRQLEKSLRQGTVKRLNREVVHLPQTSDERLAVFCHHGYLTCLSALKHYGIATWNKPDETIHVAVHKGTHSVYMDNVLLHRESCIPQCELVVPPLQAVIRAIQCVSTHLERVVIIDSALNKRLINEEELTREVVKLRRNDLIRAVEDSNRKARSPLETYGRLELAGLGYEFEVGAIIKPIGEVDMLFENKLIVEFDGYEFHRDFNAFTHDRWRTCVAAQLGLYTIRFTRDQALKPGYLRQEVDVFFKQLERRQETAEAA